MEKMVEQESFEELRERRISQREAEVRGRKTVVLLFLITILLSLSFWLKREIPVILEQIIKPYEAVVEKNSE